MKAGQRMAREDTEAGNEVRGGGGGDVGRRDGVELKGGVSSIDCR